MKIRQKITRGFSLVEVVVAIGLVALLLVGVMGLMAPATRDIDRALSKTEAKNMGEALVAEMNILRTTEEATYASAFDKALAWMNGSNTKNTCVLVYKYSGSMNATPGENPDGTKVVFKRGSTSSSVQGIDYVNLPVARLKSNTLTKDELQSGIVNGKVYLAKFKNYTRGASGLVLDSGYGTIKEDSKSPGLVAAQLEIYALKANTWNYLNSGSTDITKLGKPVYTVNVAFNR